MFKLLSSTCFVITFWFFFFVVLLGFGIWYIAADLSQIIHFVSDYTKDINKAHQPILKQLVAEGKLISAKDYFGFYISYYNNFIVILSVIIGSYGLSSFFYFKNKNEEHIRDIDNKAQEEIKKRLEEVYIKKITSDIMKEQFQASADEIYNDFAKQINQLKEKVEYLSSNIQNEEITLR